ncbi:hypothetical protein JG688_00000609 [Phytophthora aleatoria]|uniref:Uncharacterized protein n=1 Tax=Phytophthora aleatoria TaxID=2496075 RepID=A0A8J5MDT1_9STRA|nr:hypothetical protein JG688_00000609 [Phytophthora aleatoria]
MAPKFSRALDLTRRDSNSSILVQDVGPDDLDLGDCWSGRGANSAPRWRISYPQKKAPSASTWGTCFTSLSSNVRHAGAAITTRAKQLRIPTSTRCVFSHLRKSTSTLPRAASMPAQHVLNESDLDDFENFEDQPEPEDDDYDSETDKKLQKLHPSHSWNQGCS